MFLHLHPVELLTVEDMLAWPFLAGLHFAWQFLARHCLLVSCLHQMPDQADVQDHSQNKSRMLLTTSAMQPSWI